MTFEEFIMAARNNGASDIHMTVGAPTVFRINGNLVRLNDMDDQVVNRTILSMLTAEQEQRLNAGEDLDFVFEISTGARQRVNVFHQMGKLAASIRLLNAEVQSLDDLGFPHVLTEFAQRKSGLILVTGPTGSGKTTTLYALLRYMNSDDVNITTIEDPVEIKLEGINQSAINAKAGITFANSLRAILRQDPDVILIGEIRDYETLEVAISASLTGHLVLSTIHTNSAAASITRLIEMGAKDYLISSTVAGIIAQRLVKKLCPNCKEAYFPTVEDARKILTDPVEVQKLTKTKLYRPKGCASCKNSGYLGRLAVLEILVINNDIKKLIAQHAHDVELEDYAIKQGMKTLRMSCLRHILEGNTSIDEQVRILGLAGEQ